MSQTGCEQYQVQLATYRDLSPSEWEVLLRHLEGCPVCARTMAAYQHQDLVLGRLSRKTPSASLAASVRVRTIDRRGGGPGRARRWVSVVAMGVVITLVTLGGAAGASAESLPGDFLYPVKRAAEQVQYVLKPDPASREQYREALLEKRRDEVNQVTQLGREVEISFEGRLVEAEGSSWTIGGLTVEVPEGVWEDDVPQPGELLQVKAQVRGGKIIVERIRLRSTQQTRTPAKENKRPTKTGPQGAVSHPSATPQGKGEKERPSATPTVQAPLVGASATPSGAGPEESSPTPAITPHEQGPHRTVTPNDGGPSWPSTETPRIIVPGWAKTRTKVVPPGRVQTLTGTPKVVPPGHLPTGTPALAPTCPITGTPSVGGPGPLFTATPPRFGPIRLLSATPLAAIPSPTARPTKDRPNHPGNKASPTPTGAGPTMLPSPTPSDEMACPSPTATPKGPHGRGIPGGGLTPGTGGPSPEPTSTAVPQSNSWLWAERSSGPSGVGRPASKYPGGLH